MALAISTGTHCGPYEMSEKARLLLENYSILCVAVGHHKVQATGLAAVGPKAVKVAVG